MEDIFKVGDRVFHLQNGWGTVLYSPKDIYYLVRFDDNRTDFWYTKINNKVLSFTEYTLNGFSQERPEELPKKGQVVWVRDLDDQAWYVSMFWDYDPSEPDGPYVVTPNFYEGDHECYRFMTTKNPYENEQ